MKNSLLCDVYGEEFALEIQLRYLKNKLMKKHGKYLVLDYYNDEVIKRFKTEEEREYWLYNNVVVSDDNVGLMEKDGEIIRVYINEDV